MSNSKFNFRIYGVCGLVWNRLLSITLSNGIRCQWGVGSVYGTKYVNINLPISFTGTNYRIIITDYNSSWTTSFGDVVVYSTAATYTTTSRFRVVSNSENAGGFYWFAIGY